MLRNPADLISDPPKLMKRLTSLRKDLDQLRFVWPWCLEKWTEKNLPFMVGFSQMVMNSMGSNPCQKSTFYGPNVIWQRRWIFLEVGLPWKYHDYRWLHISLSTRSSNEQCNEDKNIYIIEYLINAWYTIVQQYEDWYLSKARESQNHLTVGYSTNFQLLQFLSLNREDSPYFTLNPYRQH